ncbi:LacI family DNA-binding transcriptional regulator [Phytoactinopolyspora halotolerans]|uniref:LacI family transcriptional regulator n=1 Tax=Phytoactinopolyspora halotolerans TaxID=1981512 RepID=A0A6L9SHG3_9ACTN|nr:LacI family DNA-binding transcriptional regulator [Phytoactinopolyspora halotolerans]NEE04563.1 LacI family transcriptional regulator [Phytoactinopolyspora halotolerans]
MSEQLSRGGANGNRKPSATIYDIARELELSPSTVSRALNKPGRIAAKTERRIRDAAAKLGYRGNPMARSLPTGRTRMLGLVVSDVTNPVFFRLVRGAEKACSELGYTLVLAESQESGELEYGTLDRLLPAVDGVVLAAARLEDDQIHQIAASTDVVLINRRVGELSAIVPDIDDGVAQAIDHLATLGHTSIAYLAGPAISWMSRERGERVFEHAVARGMIFVEIGPTSPDLVGGQSALRRVHASGMSAVLAYNDLMAIGLLRACRAEGIDVPGDLSIMGFDDIFGADLTTPALTTVRSPLDRAGDAAVRSLVATLDGIEPAAADPLPTEIVVRESTAAPH